MKHIAALAILFFAASVARADSYVAVVLNPFTFTDLVIPHQQMGSETIGATFLWDTTTNVLSDFTVSASGPFAVGLSNSFSLIGPAGIAILNISDPAGDLFQHNTDLHDGLYHIGSAPGTYTTDLFFHCTGCAFDDFGRGTATVTAVARAGDAALGR
jgi:hypothetical protein